MGDNNPTDYIWHPKSNKSFIARCHIETGNTWLRFGFDSDIGRVERPQDIQGNPIFIVVDSGKMLSVRGAVTIPAQDTEQMGTITFTPTENGITEWHWTLARGGGTYTEEGRGMFRPGEQKPARRNRAKKRAASPRSRLGKKKAASTKVARNKKPARKNKPASQKKRPLQRRRSKR